MYPDGGTYEDPTAIVRFALDAVPPGVIVFGANPHVTPVGSPVHDRLIALLKPPEPPALIVSAVDPPRVTDAEGAESVREKSVPAAAAGTKLANSPLVCEGPPAVK